MYDSPCVEFSKEGLLEYKWNSDIRKYESKKVLYPWTVLRSVCEIREGTTLLDIFNAVDQYEELSLFISQYSLCSDIRKFHEQAKEKPPEKEEIDKLDWLEIYWWFEKNDEDCSFGTSFHGVQKDGINNFSVSYCHLGELANLPVKLIKSYKNHHLPFNKKEKVQQIEGNKSFNLLEVLDAIYYDISFVGGVDDKVAFNENITGLVEKIQSGEYETVPLELEAQT